MEDSAGLFLQ